jgi:hypothetical protein
VTAAKLVSHLLETDDLDPKQYAYDRIEPMPDEGWVKMTSVENTGYSESAPVSRGADGWGLDDAFYTLAQDVLGDGNYTRAVKKVLNGLNNGESQGQFTLNVDGVPANFMWKFTVELQQHQ